MMTANYSKLVFMALTLKKSLEMGLIAEESEKTRKARRKLTQRLKQIDKKMTPQVLKKTREEIEKQLERRAASRVQVSEKHQELAQPSRSVQKMAEALLSEIRAELKGSQ